MATYAELNAIGTESVAGAQNLREKVRTACYIAAQIIVSGNDVGGVWNPTGHAKRTKWVDRMLATPDAVSREMFWVVLAANNGVAQGSILNATDAAVQSNVNSSIDELAANLV